MPTQETVMIFAASSNIADPGPGGWGALLRYKVVKRNPSEKELEGSSPDATNNRLGLLAVVESLSALKRPVPVDLFTSSTYVQNGITKWMPKYKAAAWKNGDGLDVPNADLWRRLEELVAKHKVKFHWLKEGVKNPDHERVSLIAKNAAQKATSVPA